MLAYKQRYGERIFSNNYEQLTDNPEQHIRTLLLWLGWPWNESYLNHHRKDRLVFNASAIKVRNPINRRSVQGWRRYADLLEPARQRLISSGLFNTANLVA